MSFEPTGPHFCPKCPPAYRPAKGKAAPARIGVGLKCVEINYSGCGVDIARCPACAGYFEVVYQVKELVALPGWHEEPAAAPVSVPPAAPAKPKTRARAKRK